MTKEIIVPLLIMGHEGLVDTFNAVPDDMLNWKPLDNGRTALDLFSESAQIPLLAEMIVKSKGQVDPAFKLPEFFQQKKAERVNWTKEEALATMETNHNAMLAAIEELSDEDLATEVTIAMRSGAIRPVGFWIMMVYRSYISRFAQINYIQTLYGDFDPH